VESVYRLVIDIISSVMNLMQIVYVSDQLFPL